MADRDAAGFCVLPFRGNSIHVERPGDPRRQKKVAERWKAYFQGPQAPFSWNPNSWRSWIQGNLALSTGPVLDPAGQADRYFQFGVAP